MKYNDKSKNDITKYIIFVLVSVVPLVSFSLLPIISLQGLGHLTFWKLLEVINGLGMKIRFIYFIAMLSGAGVIAGQVIKNKAVACVCSIVGTLYLLAILLLLWKFFGMDIMQLVSIVKYIGIGFWLALAAFIANIVLAFRI